MTEAQTVITAISTVGFPVVACVGMFYLYNKTLTEVTDAISSMTTALAELKVVIQSLQDGE